MSVPLLKRLRSMDGAELKFRARAALRTRVRRAHSTLRPPGWRREALRVGLTSGLVTACDALARSDWHEAHRCLASHFARRPAIFPLDPRQLDTLAARIASQFPANDAAARAKKCSAHVHDRQRNASSSMLAQFVPTSGGLQRIQSVNCRTNST